MKQPYYTLGLVLFPLFVAIGIFLTWITFPEARLSLMTVTASFLFFGLYVLFLLALLGGKK